jgi:hypothetical protein
MTPLEFLYLLWADKPPDDYVLIWTHQGDTLKLSHWRQNLNQAAQVIAGSLHLDCYLGVGLSASDRGKHFRCPSEEITAIAGVWQDFDLAGPIHPKKALPATLAEALSVIPAEFPPSLIVDTGHGCHAWWLLREIARFGSAEERTAAARIVHRWQTLLGLRAAARGWALDRLSDLARVMRIPGTRNYKDPGDPRPVTVLEQRDARYNLSELAWYLDQMGIPQEDAAPKPAVFQNNGDLRVNLDAALPPEQIELWLEGNERFRRTWLRQRTDLKDSTQSGYDMALTDFGFDVKLAPQQIIDLIVQHRRKDGRPARTKLNYYLLTLSKGATRGSITTGGIAASEKEIEETEEEAGNSTAAPAQKAAPDAAAPPEAAAASAPPPADPAIAKARLAGQAGRDLEIPPLLRICKITGDNPSYTLDLADGRSIWLKDTHTLINQDALRLALATSELEHFLRPFKRAEWSILAQNMLDALIKIDGGPENHAAGNMRIQLDQYLNKNPFIPEIDGQPFQNRNLPTLIEGLVAVSPLHLMSWLERNANQKLSLNAITQALRLIGATRKRVRGPNIQEQSRWLLPASNFPFAKYTKTREGDPK